MNRIAAATVSVTCLVWLAGLVSAGSIDSPGAPSAGSGMYTLQNLYEYLMNGTALTVTGSFQNATAGPASSTKTMRQIGDDIKALLDQCDATAADVKSGKKFFCAAAGSWGVQTGTWVTVTPTHTVTPTPTITPTPTPTMNWYEQYGPSGTGDVVQIGTMYIACDARGVGCYGGLYLTFDGATAWSNALEWAGKSDWRLPSYAEMCEIMGAVYSGSFTYSPDTYMTTDSCGPDSIYCVRFDWPLGICVTEEEAEDPDFPEYNVYCNSKSAGAQVRAVRSVD